MSFKTKISINKKRTVMLVSLCILFSLAVGGTLAFLSATTSTYENKFIPSEVNTDIEETFENNVKSDVSIRNTGDTEAFIRAAVIVTWKNKAGNTLSIVPAEGIDYEVNWSGLEENGGWIKGNDGFYYHLNSVAGDPDGTGNQKGEATEILFRECKLKENVTSPEEGYYLNVEIIASGIQSLPNNAVDVWDNEKVDVSANSGVLSITNKGGK